MMLGTILVEARTRTRRSSSSIGVFSISLPGGSGACSAYCTGSCAHPDHPDAAGIHPRMASERQGPEGDVVLEPPSLLALNYGRATALATLTAHIVYGVLLGVLLSS